MTNNRFPDQVNIPVVARRVRQEPEDREREGRDGISGQILPSVRHQREAGHSRQTLRRERQRADGDEQRDQAEELPAVQHLGGGQATQVCVCPVHHQPRLLYTVCGQV